MDFETAVEIAYEAYTEDLYEAAHSPEDIPDDCDEADDDDVLCSFLFENSGSDKHWNETQEFNWLEA